MKIILKVNHVDLRTPDRNGVIDVEGETALWFVSSQGHVYPKTHYEKIPLQEWRNVTAEVHVVEPNLKMDHSEGKVYHNGTCIAKLCCGGKYRLKITGNVCCIEKWYNENSPA